MWKQIECEKPADGQRVLTWNEKFNEVRIQVFNEYHECWDTEDGDDFEYSIKNTDVIRYWQELPERPTNFQI